MEHRILIKATAAHIEAIYFKDAAYDVFRSSATRSVRRAFLWVVGCGLAFILYAQGMPNSSTLIALVATAILGQSLLLGLSFNSLNKVRQQIIAFARDTERGGTAELRLTDLGFALTFKGAEHIERWSQVQHTVLAEDHILIRTLTPYIFPKAGMQAEEFATLTGLVRQHTLPLADAPTAEGGQAEGTAS